MVTQRKLKSGKAKHVHEAVNYFRKKRSTVDVRLGSKYASETLKNISLYGTETITNKSSQS